MSEDVKPKKIEAYYRKILDEWSLKEHDFNSEGFNTGNKTVNFIELEPTLQLMKEMGDILEFCSRENVSSRESKFHAKEMVEKYRKFLEGVK